MKDWHSKTELSYGDRVILARNENEIIDLRMAMRRACKHYLKSINELTKQNREILGRE